MYSPNYVFLEAGVITIKRSQPCVIECLPHWWLTYCTKMSLVQAYLHGSTSHPAINVCGRFLPFGSVTSCMERSAQISLKRPRCGVTSFNSRCQVLSFKRENKWKNIENMMLLKKKESTTVVIGISFLYLSASKLLLRTKWRSIMAATHTHARTHTVYPNSTQTCYCLQFAIFCICKISTAFA